MNDFLDIWGIPLGICAGVLITIWGLVWLSGVQAQLLQ